MTGNDNIITGEHILSFIVLIILVVIFVFADFYQDVQVLEDCKSSSVSLCESKDMLYHKHYLEIDNTVMVECNTQYEVHTYVVNCEGG